MEAVWVQSVHNLHCPACGTRLVEMAGRYAVPRRRGPVYVGEVGTLTCRSGHALPDRAALYAYRDQRGLPPQTPVREVSPPR
ncbi:hypothetical protein [Geodermatophilus sp. SYSU D00079]